MPGRQVTNGKAFEYALANTYYNYLIGLGLNVELIDDDACNNARVCYESFGESDRMRFDKASRATIDTLIKIEPGLISENNQNGLLKIRIARDAEGQVGDVRDVIFKRENPAWEIGFSAKNNNDAVKHSRLSSILDFGKSWLGVECSCFYWEEIKPIFDYISENKSRNPQMRWEELGDAKFNRIYIPLLKAFKKELLRINDTNQDVPAKLISYLIGEYPFYKIIKDDANNLVVVKAFNINGQLNKTVNKSVARYRIPAISFPTRIVEFDLKKDSNNTLNMILDGGWEISFRIHNASTRLENSLKFDIRLLGNPPILFSQYLFQE